MDSLQIQPPLRAPTAGRVWAGETSAPERLKFHTDDVCMELQISNVTSGGSAGRRLYSQASPWTTPMKPSTGHPKLSTKQ